MNSIEKSSELFNEHHFHCSQAVFGAFAEEFGISEELALKIGGCFGAGMNEGEVCGCVTGALMAIGLKYGQSKDDDVESRAQERKACMKFYDELKTENGSCICCDLLGYDFGKPEDAKYIQETSRILKFALNLLSQRQELRQS